MVAAETLPKLPELTAEQAEHWVAAALAEARALRQHDADLYPPTEDASAMRTAEELHRAWRQWADAADSLLQRLRPPVSKGCHVNGAVDLEYAIGRTRAMLRITPQDQQLAREEINRGDVVSGEELRHGLRDRLRERGAAGV